MIPELGLLALVLALVLSLLQGSLPLLGSFCHYPEGLRLAVPAARLHAACLALAFLCLTWSFVSNDFSVLYVAEHSNTRLPLIYRIAGVWGGHEGSLLLWALMLSGWTLAVTFRSRALPEIMRARVLAVLGLISSGFLLFMLSTSNPFSRLFPSVAEGRDLNPLLQDPGLVIHPPLLYMGYVGFSIAYAFAVAALLSGRLDAAWARWSRPWTTAAWIFLTLGIAVGSWWAYYELGWGGWWFWDPVENASFMPWLLGTALLHSLAVTEKRGSFRNWTVLLAIATFSLALLGTFLVRSGVLTSVHAFATDPARGVFILVFLALVVGSALLLFAWRAPKVGLGTRFALLSRESLLLGNNVLLAVAAASVLLGTLYPLLLDALNLGKISVGPPYFNAIFAPLMMPLLFLVAVGPFARWKTTRLSELTRRLRWALATAIGVALLLPWALGQWRPLIALGILLAFWILCGGILNIALRVQSTRAGQSLWRTLCQQPRHFWGMHLAHAGLAVFVLGVTIVQGYQEERDLKMAPGDHVEIAGYTLHFSGLHAVTGPNYAALRGDFPVFQGERYLRTLHPEKRQYTSSRMPMTEAAIDSGLWRDLYVSLAEPLDQKNPAGPWVVRVYYKPLVNWIWGGCLLMALGGVLVLLDRRYRLSRASPGPSPDATQTTTQKE